MYYNNNMSAYTDTTLLNCNRSASVEALSLPTNNTNPALFSNTLRQTVDLDVGDKISIERAFISEVGAGNSSTIEFKGSVRGTNKVPTYTKTVNGHKNFEMKTTYDPNYRLGNYLSMTSSEVTDDEVELRDNLAPLIFGYYITSNEYPNYTQQPRRFIQRMDERDIIPWKTTRATDNFISYDSITMGQSYFTINSLCVLEADWDLRQAAPTGTSTFYKQKCDNTRYTLFVKDFVAYSYGLTSDPIKANLQFPDRFQNGIISEANYLRVREKLEVQVNKGFNTPTAVASQITSQLTETQNEDVFNILDGKGFSRQITKTTENTTYKPMNCQNVWNSALATYNAFNTYNPEGRRADPPVLPSQLAVDYIATFGYIAVKRPEIFETGRTMMNTIVPFTAELKEVSGGGVVTTRIPVLTRNTLPDGKDPPTLIPNGFLGFQHIGNQTYFDPSGGSNQNDLKDIITNIPYTRQNLKIIRDFLDTQALYPEIWTTLVNSEIYRPSNIFGAKTLTSEKSRFFHMNLHTSDTTVNIHQQMLGQDGYHLRAAPNNINLASLPIFMAWDESQRDVYLEPESYAGYRTATGAKIDGLMYGFAVPHKEQSFEGGGVVRDRWVIKIITGDEANGAGGIPKAFFTETGETIKDGRRLGFDFNSNAYSTAIITPFSGYSNAAISTRVQFDYESANPTQSGYWSDTSNIMPNITETTKGTDIGAYMTQTYIGANNPAIQYNTVSNRFEFTRLHTANNVGNKFMAGCQFDNINNETITPEISGQARDLKPPSVNPDAADTVYKIGPRPPQFGFSPTFKPYNTHNQAYRTGVYPSTPKDQATIALAGTKNTNLIEAQNPNIEPFSIFDSHGGIYIDNFGISEDDWEDNIWDILGFDYNAVASKPTKDNVLTRRVTNNNNISLYRPTTNAETVATDAKAYVANRFGVNMYYTSLAYPMNIMTYLTGLTASGSPNYNFVLKDPDGTGEALTYIPEIVVKTQSTTITATDLQKSILKPYYTIRSSLLEGSTAIGGNPTGAALPIIGIVDKYSAYGDYFTGQSDIQFTVTKKGQISDIITSIHDPDGEYANVDKTSAVIYKIEKLKPPPVNIFAELLKESEESQKKKKK